MDGSPVLRDFFLAPGYVRLPGEPARLAAVVTSGVLVAIHDPLRRRGGMAHYALPRRPEGTSTALYAAPATVALARLFTAGGARAEDLEARLFGGAENPDAPGYVPGLGADNARAGRELLERLRIRIVGGELGGARGRKVVFHTGTGEIVAAAVERVRAEDWYPSAAGSVHERRSPT